MERLRFDGQVVVVTGAHHGLGRAYVELLASRGARVVVNDLQGAAETVAAVTASGGDAVEDTADITTRAGTDAIVGAAMDRWGRLDAVVNNAAGGSQGTFLDDVSMHETLGVHFVGTANLVGSAMEVFRERGYGRIVNTTSGSIFGIPGTGTYAAGKGAVLAWTKVLANELRAQPGLDVKVNAVMPVALTPIMPRVPDDEFQSLLDRAFRAEQVAPAVVLLAHRSCPSSGEVLQVGGGRSARVVLATTAGWAAPDDESTPEDLLEHWPAVVGGEDLDEPVGSLADLLARRGLPAYSVADLVTWARTGTPPDR